VNGVVRASADSFAIPQHTTKEPVLVTWVSDGGTEDTQDDRKRSDPIPADRKTERATKPLPTTVNSITGRGVG